MRFILYLNLCCQPNTPPQYSVYQDSWGVDEFLAPNEQARSYCFWLGLDGLEE